jgi:hypothetical protein
MPLQHPEDDGAPSDPSYNTSIWASLLTLQRKLFTLYIQLIATMRYAFSMSCVNSTSNLNGLELSDHSLVDGVPQARKGLNNGNKLFLYRDPPRSTNLECL